MIKVKQFEQFISDMAKEGLDNETYSVVGLCGEAGEVAEWHKKSVLRTHGTKLPVEALKDELGDVLHYVARIALNRGWTLKECMEANVAKLTVRYAK